MRFAANNNGSNNITDVEITWEKNPQLFPHSQIDMREVTQKHNF